MIGLILAFVFNLNRVAVLAGIWTNLPWVLGPYYAGVTAAGAWLSGTSIPPHLLTRIEDIRNPIRIDDWHTWLSPVMALGELLRPLFLPFTLGSSLGCLVLGLVAYRAALTFLIARKRRIDQPDGSGLETDGIDAANLISSVSLRAQHGSRSVL